MPHSILTVQMPCTVFMIAKFAIAAYTAINDADENRALGGDVNVHHRTMLSAALACALASATAAEPPSPGDTKQTAIEVCKPAGQQEYLKRLVCPNGEAPSYRRAGSFGMRDELPPDASGEMLAAQIEKAMSFAPHTAGAPHHHVVDGYEVACGEEKRIIYMDMYHCGAKAQDAAPVRLTLRAAASQ